MNSSNRKNMILSGVAITLLVALIIGATYAYFAAQTGDPASADIKINANTVDTLTFASGDSITLTLDQENFAKGTGNQSGSTYASALLTANNKTNTATEHYYMYVNISNNSFKYTIDENTPEIIMTITDNEGTELTSVEGLTHVTTQDASGASITGFDITNKDGLITIFNNREITATPSKEERWNVTITFVNYDKDQSANAGNSLSGKLIIRKDNILYHEMCNDDSIACQVAKLYTGTQGENGLYFHDSNLANGAGDNSYRYAGANPNNYVCFGTDYPTCPHDMLYRIIGVFDGQVKLIKYDYANSNLLGTDGDNNSSKATFSKDNYSAYKGELTTINRYYWNYVNNRSINNGRGSSKWSTSYLNKLNLNVNYLRKLDQMSTACTNMIDDATWYLGNGLSNNVKASVMYTDERNNEADIYGPENGTSKIGLMYASDYGFAAAPSAWTRVLFDYSESDESGELIRDENWMYMGLAEWTLSPRHSYGVLGLTHLGSLNSDRANDYYAVRPVFYLKSSVKKKSGDGSINSPLRVGL